MASRIWEEYLFMDIKFISDIFYIAFDLTYRGQTVVLLLCSFDDEPYKPNEQADHSNSMTLKEINCTLIITPCQNDKPES